MSVPKSPIDEKTANIVPSNARSGGQLCAASTTVGISAIRSNTAVTKPITGTQTTTGMVSGDMDVYHTVGMRYAKSTQTDNTVVTMKSVRNDLTPDVGAGA